MFLDNFEDIVREVYVSYSTSKFQIRFGRQQIGWGESDGLRLMDVINPLDVRRGPFYDTQGYSEVRIPKWLLKTEYYPEPIGPFNDIVFQFIWNPGDIQEQQQLQLPGYVDAHITGMNQWRTMRVSPVFWEPLCRTEFSVTSQLWWRVGCADSLATTCSHLSLPLTEELIALKTRNSAPGYPLT